MDGQSRAGQSSDLNTGLATPITLVPPDEYPMAIDPTIVQCARATAKFGIFPVPRRRKVHAYPKASGIALNLQTFNGNEWDELLGLVGFALSFFDRDQSKLISFNCR